MDRFRTITVKELRELLEDHADDARVIFSTDYGDYHHTEQALPLKGDVFVVTISESAYSNSGFAVNDSLNDSLDENDADYDDEYLLIK